MAQAPTISTDREDYLPGDIVLIEGDHWLPGEQVRLEIDHSTVSHGNTILTATADASGHVYNDEFLIQPIHLGESFTLMASGQRSGLSASTTFTDGRATLEAVTVGPAATAQYMGVAGTITFAVTVTRVALPIMKLPACRWEPNCRSYLHSLTRLHLTSVPAKTV